MTNTKPLGGKAYGSIPHLPCSRLGAGDHSVSPGQAQICTNKARDKHDRVIVQEKLDGSCMVVAKLSGQIVPLMRAGYLATSSKYPQHHMFADWVAERSQCFTDVLGDGERLAGEWLAQAHGTLYNLVGRQPFGVFDIFDAGGKRLLYDEMTRRIDGAFERPTLLHGGPSISVAAALCALRHHHWRCDCPEGVVYRVERHGRVDFLAKFVRRSKVDGKYLPEISGEPAVWNWPVSLNWSGSACAS